MARKRWRDLNPRVRQAILLAGAFEAGLRVAALIDLSRRPAAEVHGPKKLWGAAIAVVNSGGAVPILYLLHGRKPRLVVVSGPSRTSR